MNSKTPLRQYDMEKDKNNIREELQGLSPFLADLHSKDSGQKAPEDYFDQLESEVFRKIEEGGYQREAPTGSTPVWRGLIAIRRSRFAMAAAAVFALVFGAWWFFRMQPASSPAVPENYQELAAALTAEDAAAYIAGNIHEFETATLETYVAVEPAAESTPERPSKRARPLEDLSEEQLDLLLQDLSDEELEEIL
jgi:hypothetical protein